MGSTRLIVLLTVCLATCQLLNATPEQPHTSASTLTGVSTAAGSVLDDIHYIRQQIHSFWQRHGPDVRYGGFHGTLDRSGAAILPTAKDLVQETRHIWCACSAYQPVETSLAAGLRRCTMHSRTLVPPQDQRYLPQY